jgi:hypothetical protein
MGVGAWARIVVGWATVAPFLKIPRWGRREGAEPVYPWDRIHARPKEAMMIIQRLKLPRAAILVFRVSTALQAASKD